MTRLVICDVCEKAFAPGEQPVEFAGGDYHDTAACIGAIQAAWAEAKSKVKKPTTTGS